jgi:hypothetical protein
MIETLPLLTPDATRSATTMARCHDELAARRRRIEARHRPPGLSVAVERLLIAGLCAVYLVSMTGNVLQIVAP